MLDYIIINAPISPIEANYFTANSTFQNFKLNSNGGKTTELKSEGIVEVNIWFNLKKVVSEPLTAPFCAINATIDAIVLEKQNLDELLNKIESYLPISSSKIYNFKKISELAWKIKSATFTFNFTGTQIETYYKFLRGGYNLAKSKLQKTISKSATISKEKKTVKVENAFRKKFIETSVSLTEYSGITKINSDNYYESLLLSIDLRQEFILNDNEEKREKKDKIERKLNGTDHEIHYIPERKYKDRLQIKIQARRKKIISICNDETLLIPNRDVKIFLENKVEIEKKLFEDYITLITGRGDFFKYKDAEKIIQKSEDYSKKEKDKMCDVLKAVGSYQGISNYLEHVEDEKTTYNSMRSVRKRVYALTVLKNIQKCGINPLTIPVRQDIQFNKLDNLVAVYNNHTEKGANDLTAQKESMISNDTNSFMATPAGYNEEDAPFE